MANDAGRSLPDSIAMALAICLDAVEASDRIRTVIAVREILDRVDRNYIPESICDDFEAIVSRKVESSIDADFIIERVAYLSSVVGVVGEEEKGSGPNGTVSDGKHG